MCNNISLYFPEGVCLYMGPIVSLLESMSVHFYVNYFVCMCIHVHANGF